MSSDDQQQPPPKGRGESQNASSREVFGSVESVLATLDEPAILFSLRDSRVLLINPAARVQLAIPADASAKAITRLSWWRKAEFDRVVQAAVDSYTESSVEVDVHDGSRRRKYVVRVSAVDLDDCRGILLVFREQRESGFLRPESDVKYQGVLTAIAEGGVIVKFSEQLPISRDYVVQEVNASFAQLFDLDPLRAVGRQGTEVFRASSPPFADLLWGVAQSGAASVQECQLPGSGRTFRVSAFRIRTALVGAIVSETTERHERIEVPVTDPGGEDSAGPFEWVTDQSGLGSEQEPQSSLRRDVTQLRYSVRRLKYLVNATRALSDTSRSFADRIQTVVQVLPSAMRGSKQAVARLLLGGEEYASAERFALGPRVSSRIFANDMPAGRLDVAYSVGTPGEALSFAAEEQNLVDLVGVMVGNALERRRALAALEASEKRYRSLLDEMGEGLFIVDSSLILCEHNTAFARLCGYAGADDLVGMPLLDVADADAQRLLRDEVFEPLLNSSDDDFAGTRVSLRRDSGDQIVLDVRAQAVREGGEVVGVRGLARDVTAQVGAEARVKVKETLFRAVFEGSPVGVVVLGSIERRFLEANQAFSSIVGYSRAELSNMSLDEITHPEDRWTEAPEGSLTFGTNDYRRLIRKDGAVVFVQTSFAPVAYTAGGTQADIVVIEDFTHRKAVEDGLKESEARLFQILDSIPAGVAVVEADARTLYFANQALRRLLSAETMAQAVGVRADPCDALRDLATGLPYERERVPLFRALSGEHVTVADMVVKHDEGDVVLHATASPIRDQQGGVELGVGVFVDISALERTRTELEQTLSMLARSNRDLEQFAYVASHDLQEPLRMVSSFTQLLADRYVDALDEQAKEFIDFAVDGAKRMQSLIDDLLTYSRISRESPSFTTIDANAALADAIRNLRHQMETSGATVDASELPCVLANQHRLTQLFQNLISNAIKFRSREAPVVRVWASRDGAMWRFSVADDGLGVDQKSHDRIFQIFQRLHPRHRYPGTGIGLALCKQIVERHGGRIWLESKEGEGSTFHFTLRTARDNIPTQTDA